MPVSTPPPYQCPTCVRPSVIPRNLAVFIDGTSNKPGDENTNVKKLCDQIKTVREGSEPEQDQRYFKGIGAYDPKSLPPHERMGKKIYSAFEMAFAWNAEKNVKDAYTWLRETYREGDRIYLFGFSRGAYQVRTLASMIHEVGLVKENDDIDAAYGHYLAINPYNPETRRDAMTFRKNNCWRGVRIHFVGVWDTVSSLGLVKRDVHITASATVANACHFRHALALDERRVKFIPEYFEEVNAHRSNIQSQRDAVGDVKEVWFAGSHSDVGGMSRGHDPLDIDALDNSESYPVHAGNVPLLWMRREAVDNGLVFQPEDFTWAPEDVDRGRKDTMMRGWKFLENLPIRHQVSFSGTGKHERSWHRSRTRSVIPAQQIHSSILSGDVYTPSATLRESVHIPTVPGRGSDKLWTTELPDKGETMRLLILLLNEQPMTLGSLEKMLSLLNSRLENGVTETISIPQFSEESLRNQSGFDKLALTVIYDVLSNFSTSEALLNDARDPLCATLSSPADSPAVFCVLRLLTRQEKLRERFIAHENVIKALVLALKSSTENLFLLITDGLRNLIDDDDQREKVFDQLRPESDETRAVQTGLEDGLNVEASSKKLVASLKTIASFARYKPGICNELEPRIADLARTRTSSVGSAAVEALAALNVRLTDDIHISNILGYLGDTLPPLDVEGGNTSSPDDTSDLPPGLQGQNSGELATEVMDKLLLVIESSDARERTAATLTLLKLCRYRMIRNLCLQKGVVHTFVKQLKRKETSLLAAYALKTCLERGMTPANFDFGGAAKLIVAMLDKGWFDDAVGRVEGFEIFRGLMTSSNRNLRQKVMDDNLGVVANLIKKLEGGERHDVRTSLICLDILENDNSADLTQLVERSINNLKADSEKVRTKGVKILAALAQTKAGEQAISERVTDIVRMLPPSGSSSRQRSKSLGPAAAIYDLSKNETLRKQIQTSGEFINWKGQYPRRTGTVHSRGRAT